ncbi:MAG: NAD(P)H-hydrate dehydratase [Clostridia bacterium]|nr:NAD(P)H-hydrate dehydratase [Clostridia bacterium]
MKILTRSQIRAAEESAVANGTFSFEVLMLNAGRTAAKKISERYDIKGKRISVVCGKGNNGGDGIVVANELSQMGAFVRVCFPLGKPKTDTAASFMYMLNDIDVAGTVPKESDIIIDALFGTGLKGELLGEAAEIIDSLNLISGIKISIDIPSGVLCDEGECKKAFKADYTVTFIALKPCFVLPNASEYCGEVEVADIGVPVREYTYLTVPKPIEKKRPKNSHKGMYGTALLICGSYGMCGAEILSAKAAAVSGVGIVKAVVCDKNYTAFCTSLPEAVTVPVPTSQNGTLTVDDNLLKTLLTDSDAVLLGCGLGTSEEAKRLVKRVLQTTKIPIIIDADGINALSKDINIIRTVKAPVILTPHSGEMARLCGTDVKDIEHNRVMYAKRFATQNSCVLVLKGANTIVAAPDGRVFFNTTGNAGMATGGSGDVLAGMIVARLAKGEGALNSALSSVWLHGRAGDLAANKLTQNSLLPSDIITELRTLSD